jgi:opacity protein-like surface antigen
MRKLLFLAVLIVGSASMAFAQTTDFNKVEFFGGFSHNRVDTGIDDSEPELSDIINEREGFNGFNTSITGNISRYVGLKGDFSGHYKKKTIPLGGSTASFDLDSSVYNFLGGVQIKDNATDAGSFKPFAHALVGAARVRNKVDFSNNFCVAIFPSPCVTDFTDSETGFAAAIGGGIDIRVSKRVDFRAIQFDYNPTRVFDATQHNFRIGVGLVFR